ncbi:MAG: hypothetical protein A4E72_01820 [Syntrophus sp. PtaU1.Bin208]|nr:MAG: hypothetical protein A4E72_01820 [Syntrophus sp. PtaU1.Bin208]
MDLFKGIAIFVGWLTSSLAGIVAIFYSCGYLVVRAQLNMLGLFGLFEYPKEHYLQEGGKFFVAVASMLVGKLLTSLVYAFYIFAFASLLILLFLAVCYFSGWRSFLERCGRLKSYILATPGSRLGLWSSLLLFCFAFVLVFHVLGYVNDFAAVLGVSNLLYDSSETIRENTETSRIAGWLLQGDSRQLQSYFLYLVKGELLAALLLIAAWHTASMFQKTRLWLVSPFIIVFVLYTIFTPMVYGVLVRPTKYAVVSFKWKGEPMEAVPASLYLLNKSDQEYVVWDRDHKRVLCISKDLVWGAQVSEFKPLFHHSDKNR